MSTFLGPKAASWRLRRLHEATVHRADAAIALGAPYQLSAELAADGITEWLDQLALTPLWPASGRSGTGVRSGGAVQFGAYPGCDFGAE